VDAGLASLDKFLTQWTRPVAYATRLKQLTGELSGSLSGTLLLNASMLLADNEMDRLTGGLGYDALFGTTAARSGVQADLFLDALTAERKVSI
jgi:hypothetical protein